MSISSLATTTLQELSAAPLTDTDRRRVPVATTALDLPPTPVSPGLMFVSAPRDESPPNLAYASGAESTPQLTSSATSPSTTAMLSQPSQQHHDHLLPSMTSTTMITTTVITFPTSVSNMSRSGGPYIRKNDHGDDGDVQMKRDDDGVTAKATESALAEDYVTIDRAQDPPQTDQRQSPTMEDVNALPNLSKRPRDGNDEAEAGAEAKVQRIKRRRVGEVKPGLERLHEDVGPLYLLCRNPHRPVQPDFRQDLLSMYSLQGLAATVARMDPVTGEKRKIRKTYKGKIQAFGLAGRNQEVKHPEGQPGGLLEMVQWPEDEWQTQKVMGKELEMGLGDSILAKLDRALRFEPGPLPDFDASVLGLDGPIGASATGAVVAGGGPGRAGGGGGGPAPAPGPSRKASQAANKIITTGAGPTKRTTLSISGPSAIGVTSPGATTNVPESARPKRAGKKRRYDDRSFEGYEQGFVDDEGGGDENLVVGGSGRSGGAGSGSGGMGGGQPGGGGGGGGYSVHERDERKGSFPSHKKRKKVDLILS